MSFEQASQIRCFQNREYKPDSPKCIGGLDPTVIDARTGGRKYRPRCEHLDLCRARAGYRSADAAPASAYAGAPMRSLAPLPAPHQAPMAPMATPTPYVSRSMQPVQHNYPEPSRVPYHQGMMMMSPEDAYYGPTSIPVATPPPPAVPSILTHPEPMREDVSPWARWGCELLRAGMGAVCQQSAYSMYTTPWIKPRARGKE